MKTGKHPRGREQYCGTYDAVFPESLIEIVIRKKVMGKVRIISSE